MPTYVPCVAFDQPEFALFCDHINSRLCVIDFIYKFRELQVPGYNPHAPATLILPINQAPALTPLFESDYAALIQAVCNRVTISSHSLDAFRSELDDETVSFFIEAISVQRTRVSVIADPARHAYVVALPDFLSDLILPALSQMHTAVVAQCCHFAEMIAARGGNAARIFLNARASSAFSMFILTWVANRMSVPLRFGDHNANVMVI
ncbi:hypothetical protein NA78x_002722 [Anatilimnocola sp. NA78]|uniref:hypothetical protein n=1 Tax=Anatilimnocola sp. NA78 TaxID=3415683 RepID=UPI003CE49ED3